MPKQKSHRPQSNQIQTRVQLRTWSGCRSKLRWNWYLRSPSRDSGGARLESMRKSWLLIPRMRPNSRFVEQLKHPSRGNRENEREMQVIPIGTNPCCAVKQAGNSPQQDPKPPQNGLFNVRKPVCWAIKPRNPTCFKLFIGQHMNRDTRHAKLDWAGQF